MPYRLLLASLALPLALGTLGAEDKTQAKILANIKKSETQANPALFINQTRIEKPKVDPAQPAGAGVRVTEVPDPKPKNTFTVGLGFSTSNGVQLTAEFTTKENLKRTCTMAFPNLFFRIPASLRKESDSDQKPAGEVQPVDEDPISLAGTQLLGRPDATSLDRSK